MKTKFFHASPKRFRVGDILDGQHSRGVEYSNEERRGYIYLTTAPEAHYSILECAWEENWNVYEVLPIGEVKFSWGWDEIIVREAMVLRFVGSTRGICRKRLSSGISKKTGEYKIKFKGSMVDPRKQRFPAPIKVRGTRRGLWREEREKRGKD